MDKSKPKPRTRRYGPRYDYRTDNVLRNALEMVHNGETINKAAFITGLGNTTIRKYYAMYLADIESKSSADSTKGVHDIFTSNEENTLIEYFNVFASMFFGITDKECRILAYQMAVKKKLDIPVEWSHGMAESEWPQYLRDKYPRLSFEKPERCTAKSLRSVNEKRNVTDFYDNLEKIVHSNPALRGNSRIFSADEIFVDADIDSISKYRNECKGNKITICCIVSASGESLPPINIEPYPSVPINRKIQPGAITLISPGGRTHWDLFPLVIQHFVKHSNSSQDNPSLLIIDTDICHLSINAFDLAKQSGVHILTIHPHTSKLLQPLAVGLFDLFRKHYYEDAKSLLIETPESENVINSIRNFIADAYLKTMTPENITSAFTKCGITPFDRDLFTDEDYRCFIKDPPCTECKARDDRSKRPDLPNSENSKEITSSSPTPGTSEDSLVTSTENSAASGETEVPKPKEAPKSASEMADRQSCASELDKLKRRMIRAVARLLKEKKSEEQVWEELKKESGANCKALWERMRSLTIKKLKRLMDVHDRLELLPTVARMTLTDWLLYDMVIVHEKVDVIDSENPSEEENKVLRNLFSLVQLFSIEGRRGDDLAEAWTAATVYYNAKGHQCSPMLMQRRWYQIKELTRHKMYKFWFSYRGNQKLLITAKQDAPTDLQKAIALKYPQIITQPFPDWHERIEMRLVIMPDEFEVKMRKKTLMKPSDANVPDIVIVEPKVDTITLADSDSEFSEEEIVPEPNPPPIPDDNIDNQEMQTPIIVQVKTEPQDDIDVSETIYQPPSEVANNRLQEEIDRLAVVEDKIEAEENLEGLTEQDEECVMPLITNVQGADDINKKDIVEDNAPVDEKELKVAENTDSQQSILIDDDDDVLFSDVKLENNAQTAEETEEMDQTELNSQNEATNPIKAINQTEVTDLSETTNPIQEVNQTVAINLTEAANQAQVFNESEELNQTENIIDITSPEPKRKKMEPVTPIVEMLEVEEPTINAEAISSIASGSAFTMDIASEILTQCRDGSVADVILPMTSNEHSQIPGQNEMIDDTATCDLDLGNDVISEMNFADDGIEFADEGIEYVENDDNDGTLVAEITSNSLRNAEGSPKFDLKLLMVPIVYTTKLDEMSVYKNRELYDTIETRELVDKITVESKPVCANSIKVEPENTENFIIKVENQDPEDTNDPDDNLFQYDSYEESDSDEYIPENRKVKISSKLLQKPKSRSYNSIQLCKNPDFNTRLKRLTVGFFSSTRNRVLLKACKPMTIDLSKAFESKLVDGTMYLKPSDQTDKVEVEDLSKSTSILPSAVAVQSLMDTTDVDKILQEELKKRMIERNKPITLPHISVVRQINQKLLMAEVAPIMAQNDKSDNAENASSHTQALIDDKTDIRQNQQNDIIIDIHTDVKVVQQKSPPPYSEAKPNYPSSPARTQEIEQKINDIELIKEHSTLSKNPLLHNLLQVNQPANLRSNYSSNETFTHDTLEKAKPDETFQQLKLDKLDILDKRKKVIKPTLPAWITKSSNTDPSRASDTLLTIDTLYKMLNALDPCKEYSSNFKQKKKISKSCKNNTKSKTYSDSNTNKKQESMDVILIDSESKETSVSSINNKSVTQNINAVTKASTKSKKKACCWAKSKILKLTGATPNARLTAHKCGQHCTCCCEEQLRIVELEIEVRILNESRHASNVQSAIENVVQQSINQSGVQIINIDGNPELQQPESVTTEDVGLQIDLDQSDVVEVAVQTKSSSNLATEDTSETNTESISQSVEEEVTIDLDNEDEYPTSLNDASLPTPKIRVYTGDAVQSKTAKLVNRRTRSRGVGPAEAKQTPIQPRVIPSKPSTKKSLSEHELPCSCRPNVAVEKSSAMLCIDGSNECIRHSTGRVSKETRIYINRKHMSDTERPFYVGKNKILLTNVRQPAPPPPAPVELTLPEGVQVILLPDGTVSYLVDPNVQLTADQTAAMPLILNAVREQIKAAGITLPVADVDQFAQDNNNASSQSAQTETNNNVDSNNEENNKTNENITTSTSSDTLQSDTIDSRSNDATTSPDVGKEPNENFSAQTNITSGSSDAVNTKSSVSKTELDGINVVSEVINDTNNRNLPDDIENKTNDANKDDVATSIAHETESTNEAHANKETAVMDPSGITKTSTSSLPAANGETDIENNANNVNIAPEVAIDTIHEKACSPPNEGTSARDTTKTVEPLPATTDSEHNYAESPEKNNASSENVEETNAAKTSRNLLSDLMEMSGIMEEDVAPQESTAPAGVLPDSLMPPLQPLTVPSTPIDSLIPGLSAISSKNTIAAQIDEKMHELNAITSFADLKYACEHDGLFFKLDLNTGVIVPINVCIQKGMPESQKKMINPTEVIDLTDEQGVSIDEQRFSVTQNNADGSQSNIEISSVNTAKKLTPRKLSTMMPDKRKPVQTLLKQTLAEQSTPIRTTSNIILPRRRGRPPKNTYKINEPVYSPAYMDLKKQQLLSRLSNNLKPLRMLRKQNLNILRNVLTDNEIVPRRKKSKLEATIDLVDSDAPMEAEYLVDESSDESDDEPLAKVARKMRSGINGQDNGLPATETLNEEVSPSDSASQGAVPLLNDTNLNDTTMEGANIDFEQAIDALPIARPANIEEPVPTQLVLSGPSLNQPILLGDAFLANNGSNDEDSQDDCILGV